jgi:hypothetical protein
MQKDMWAELIPVLREKKEINTNCDPRTVKEKIIWENYT